MNIQITLSKDQLEEMLKNTENGEATFDYELSAQQALDVYNCVNRESYREDVINRIELRGLNVDDFTDKDIDAIIDEYEENLGCATEWQDHCNDAINFYLENRDEIKKGKNVGDYTRYAD